VFTKYLLVFLKSKRWKIIHLIGKYLCSMYHENAKKNRYCMCICSVILYPKSKKKKWMKKKKLTKKKHFQHQYYSITYINLHRISTIWCKEKQNKVVTIQISWIHKNSLKSFASLKKLLWTCKKQKEIFKFIISKWPWYSQED